MFYRSRKQNLLLMSFLTLAVMIPSSVFAHFIWLAKSMETGKVQVFFGEGPHPDNAKFLSGIEGMKIWSLDAEFNPTEITYSKQTKDDNGWFDCVSETDLKAVDGDCSYGVFSRGEKSMFLHYTAKYLDHKNGTTTEPSGKLPLDIVVDSSSGKLKAKILFLGKPAENCEVSVFDDKGNEQKLKSNADGIVNPEQISQGRFLLRAKAVEQQPGEADGKSYSEKVYYCTLTLDNAVASTITSAKMSEKSIAEMPVGITSFGGARVGNHVYIYGGHAGDAHHYCAEDQNKTLFALDLENPTEWKAVGEGIGLQGLAMVAHDGKLYRIGGFNARNKDSEEQDLHSVTDFAEFDFNTNDWKMLTPMPTARSSFDAVVVGDTIYVIGGWEMKGEGKTTWSDSAISIDMSSEDPQWETLPTPPFQRRAISVGYQGNHLVVIGGMQKVGGPTTKVAMYDIESGNWSEGPGLPGEQGMEGFGSSCFNVGGSLVASTYGGNVYRLDEAKKNWQPIHVCDQGRFFHRLLPISDNEFALFGGANMESGKTMNVEVFELDK